MLLMRGVFLDIMLYFFSSSLFVYLFTLFWLSGIEPGTFPSPLHFAIQTKLLGIDYDWYYRESTKSQEE